VVDEPEAIRCFEDEVGDAAQLAALGQTVCDRQLAVPGPFS
jgi:hypothetical protein